MLENKEDKGVLQMERKVKQTKIQNQAHYHYNDIISLKNFESKLSEIDKKTRRN